MVFPKTPTSKGRTSSRNTSSRSGNTNNPRGKRKGGVSKPDHNNDDVKEASNVVVVEVDDVTTTTTTNEIPDLEQPTLKKKKKNPDQDDEPSTTTSTGTSSTNQEATIITVEVQKLLHDMYHTIAVVTNPTTKDHHPGEPDTSRTGSHQHRYKYLPQLRTLVWPVFCTMVQQHQNEVKHEPNDQGSNNTKTSISLQQVALLIAYLLSMEGNRDGGNVTESTLDFVRYSNPNSENDPNMNDNATIVGGREWCQLIFGNETMTNCREEHHLSSQQQQQQYFTDWTVRIHCMNMIWSCLSQQYYKAMGVALVHRDNDENDEKTDTRSNRHPWNRDMFTTICQNYIASNTIPVSMPPRYREWYIKRTTTSRTLMESDHQVPSPSPSISIVVRMIQQVLLVFESPDILFVPNKHATVSQSSPPQPPESYDENDIDEDEEDEDDDDPAILKDSADHTTDDMDMTIMNPDTTSKETHDQQTQNAIWSFIHRALELLCDLLSTPAIPTEERLPTAATTSSSQYSTTSSLLFHREPIIEYLISIHFMIRCSMCLQQQLYLSKTHESKHLPYSAAVTLTQQLLHRLSKWMYCFPVSVLPHHFLVVTSGTTADTRSIYYHRATIFQKFCHRYYSTQLSDIIYAGPGLLCSSANNHPTPQNSSSSRQYAGKIALKTDKAASSSFLRQALEGLNTEELYTLLYKMRLVDTIPPPPEAKMDGDDVHNQILSTRLRSLYFDRNFLLAVLEEYLIIPIDPSKELQTNPLYPTESLLWDFSQIPSSRNIISSDQCGNMVEQHTVLPIPKLTTRYLNFVDYLGRNFELVQYESAYEIRLDLVDAIRRVQPVVRHITQPSVGSEDHDGTAAKTVFTGWARMALELKGVFEIKQVNKPLLGEIYPSQVTAEFTIDLKLCNNTIRQEWDDLGEYDILFLIAIDASKKKLVASGNEERLPDEDDPTFSQRYGVTLVRGCMILQVRDETGTVLNNFDSTDASSQAKNQRPSGTKRIFRVALDPTQYSRDRNASTTGMTDMYSTFNLVVRRSGKVNNFKAVLETIRGLMVGVGSIDRVIPTWLQSAVLGHGNPIDPTYQSDTMKEYAKSTMGVPNPDAYLDYGDTFMDEAHLRASFKDLSDQIIVDGRGNMMAKANDYKEDGVSQRQRNYYRVRVVDTNDVSQTTTIEAVAYQPSRRDNVVHGNLIRFTPRQVEAVRSGLSLGLSLIVGPPGTGKTDVAVQIIACLYHSFPTQRTIIITHSNAALNDIFQKVVARGDIDERYMIRLGSGERELKSTSTHDFTKQGRVAYSLSRRGVLLEMVQQLSESLGISGRAERGMDGAPAYTCETADIFFSHHIQKQLNKFEKEMLKLYPGKVLDDDADATKSFPFSNYFKLEDVSLSYAEAKAYIHQIDEIFHELAEYRPLEILRSQRQRSDYLIMKQARVVAMTCTHAAIARSHLLELGFEYDNVVVEEAGQMLEIESFVPLLLQRGDATSSANGSTSISRLKRCCIIGDHHQLPPVIQNMAFARYSSFDQSLFARLIRFGVPYIQLDQQGRCRPEIASLFNWRYKKLGNLDRVLTSTEYITANAGLQHTMQLINVDDFEGKGETAPTPFFYQNVGEAEYVVAVFQYMVLIGHKPESISILTTYNGQKALIDDILNIRCGNGTPLVGVRPRAVSTVDQYQGQQNDIILLSLVRTGPTVGHIRDIRRLIVAVSRARFGLYVFCRLNVFRYVHDVQRVLDLITQHSHGNTKLQLIVGEQHPTERKLGDPVTDDQVYEVDDVVHMGSIVHQMQETMLQDVS